VSAIAPTPVQADRLASRARRWRGVAAYAKLAVLVAFMLAPLVAPSFQTLDLTIKIALFAALVASYDVLIGYTGIVSFGHAMFFGVGAYAVALALTRLGAATYGHLLAGFAAGILVATVLALLVGAFSLRVKALFFAMITLAFAEFAVILAVQWTELTGGEDGLSPRLPGVLAVSFDGGRVLGVAVTGRLLTSYLVLAVCLGLFLAMLRFVHSPLGRSLQAIRDNALRAEALGVPVFRCQMIASSFASVVAAVIGGCYALWVRYVNPESTLGVPIMLDVLLMVIIGGIGTLYGGLIGATVLLAARLLLPYLRSVGAALAPGSAVVEGLTERWLLYFGVLFILVVFFFPKGVLGTAQEALARRRHPRP
jgi:branched-chain amino acid transport system permease protein